MPTITDWLMVLITFIYSIVTYKILKENKESADVAKAQLQESKRQFDEETRLQFMPWLQVDIIPETEEIKQKHFSTIHDCNLKFDEYRKVKTSDLNTSVYLSIRNIGHDVAVRTAIHWEIYNKPTSSNGFAILTLGESKEIKFNVQSYSCKESCSQKATLVFKYQDLLENSYTQKIEFEFLINEFQITLISIGTRKPELEAKEGEKNA